MFILVISTCLKNVWAQYVTSYVSDQETVSICTIGEKKETVFGKVSLKEGDSKEQDIWKWDHKRIDFRQSICGFEDAAFQGICINLSIWKQAFCKSLLLKGVS